MTQILLQLCFIFAKMIFWLNAKYRGLGIHFGILPLKWIKISRTQERTVLKKSWQVIKMSKNCFYGTEWPEDDYNIHEFLFKILLIFKSCCPGTNKLASFNLPVTWQLGKVYVSKQNPNIYFFFIYLILLEFKSPHVWVFLFLWQCDSFHKFHINLFSIRT